MVGSITYHHLCWWSHHFSWANPIVNPTFLQILPRILSPFVVFFYRFFPIFCTDFRLPGHQLTNRRPFEASSSPWPWSNGRPSAQKWGTRSVAVSSQGMGWGFMGFNEPTLYRYHPETDGIWYGLSRHQQNWSKIEHSIWYLLQKEYILHIYIYIDIM